MGKCALSELVKPESLVGLMVTYLAMSMFVAAAHAGAKDYGAICDEYALNRYDLDAPAGANGVSFANVPQSDEAIHACEKAVEAAPQKRRYVTQLARIELRAGRFDQALAHYRKAADAGSAMALFALGFMNQNGCGTSENLDDAMGYYKAAAGLGQTSAMINLARARRIGWNAPYGPEEDKNAERVLLEQASAAGNADAMALLGNIYLYTEAGEPKTKPDLDKAFEWYRKAYEGGSERSYWPLFLFYYHDIKGNPAAISKAADVAHTAISENSLSFVRLMKLNRKSLPKEVVRSIQDSLKEQGYLRGSADGIFGSGTEAALRKLESAIEKKAGDYGGTCRYGGA